MTKKKVPTLGPPQKRSGPGILAFFKKTNVPKEPVPLNDIEDAGPAVMHTKKKPVKILGERSTNDQSRSVPSTLATPSNSSLGYLFASFQNRQASSGTVSSNDHISAEPADLFPCTQPSPQDKNHSAKVIWAASPSDEMLKSVLSEKSSKASSKNQEILDLTVGESIATPAPKRTTKRSFSLGTLESPSLDMNFRNKKLKSTTVHWSGRQDKSKLHQLLEKVEESFSSSVSFQELKSPAAVRPNGNFGRSFSIPSDMGSTKMTPVLDVPTHRSLFLAPVMMDPINEKENIPTVVTNSKEDFDAFSDFDDGLLSFELEAAIQLAETQGSLFHKVGERKRQKFTRFLVIQVTDLGYQQSSCQCEKRLMVVRDPETHDGEFEIWLKDDWYDLDVMSGDYIHVTGVITAKSFTIDNSSTTLLILHPDVLISATHVADAFECQRKAILQTRVRATGETSKYMVYGNILHRLLQLGLTANNFTISYLTQCLTQTINESTEELYRCGVDEASSLQALQEHIVTLSKWGAEYVNKPPRASRKGDNSYLGTIKKVLDIEEKIWSPMYGIKGNIDATVLFESKSLFGNQVALTPFEFKTGKKAGSAHEAQTALYTLLLTDKYDAEVVTGALFYLVDTRLKAIPRLQHHIRSLIMGRNALAVYMMRTDVLPPMLTKRDFVCRNCYALDKCLIYHKGLENGTVETSKNSGLAVQFEEKLGHLTDRHIEFFRTWESLISLEENETSSRVKEIWALTGAERETLRRCFSNVVIDSAYQSDSAPSSGMTPFRYQFIRATSLSQTVNSSFQDSQIKIGDPVVISSDDGHFGLAIGYVHAVTEAHIICDIDRPLNGLPAHRNDYDDTKNQDFVSYIEAFKERSTSQYPARKPVYRIDLDEFSSRMGMARDNIVSLISSSANERLRKLIVDLEAPYFVTQPSQIHGTSNLNPDQRTAIDKVMSARDFALILGMPGTGKTFTICQIVKSLVQCGKSVLLTSYTHLAVDNILLKLVDEDVDFVRLGNGSKIHPKILPYTPNANNELQTVAQLENFYASKWVVATTCLGIGHAIFSKRKFDYCIVDEASQLTLPACLGPLRFASTFVLVGDHYQLSPLVKNEEAAVGGMNISLFKRLCEAHPEAVVSLSYQYRMNSDILQLSNTLFYNNRLKCGTQEVADAAMSVPHISQMLQRIHSMSPSRTGKVRCAGSLCWIQTVVQPRGKALFIDTDGLPAPETKIGDFIQNDTEATIIEQIVDSLVLAGASTTQISILSVYHAQLKILQRRLSRHTGIEMNTIDRCQGRDNDCIIISLVRSNSKGTVGELLRDWRRLNVAFTRAKRKLIIVGSQSTLKNLPTFAELFKLMGSRGCIVSLPASAHLLHSTHSISTPPQ